MLSSIAYLLVSEALAKCIIRGLQLERQERISRVDLLEAAQVEVMLARQKEKLEAFAYREELLHYRQTLLPQILASLFPDIPSDLPPEVRIFYGPRPPVIDLPSIYAYLKLNGASGSQDLQTVTFLLEDEIASFELELLQRRLMTHFQKDDHLLE